MWPSFLIWRPPWHSIVSLFKKRLNNWCRSAKWHAIVFKADLWCCFKLYQNYLNCTSVIINIFSHFDSNIWQFQTQNNSSLNIWIVISLVFRNLFIIGTIWRFRLQFGDLRGVILSNDSRRSSTIVHSVDLTNFRCCFRQGRSNNIILTLVLGTLTYWSNLTEFSIFFKT